VLESSNPLRCFRKPPTPRLRERKSVFRVEGFPRKPDTPQNEDCAHRRKNDEENGFEVLLRIHGNTVLLGALAPTCSVVGAKGFAREASIPDSDFTT